MTFQCDKCGICCRHIDLLPQLKEFDMGDGICIHLANDNTCLIYDHRPDICNVDKMYDLVYYKQMSKDEYLTLNADGCKELKRKYS